MDERRLIVVDACLHPRVASILEKRGRRATSVQRLELKDMEDPELLADLRQRFNGVDWVLLTGDDNMPSEHAEIVDGLTIATVDGRWEGRGFTQEQWKWETCHRWAHYIAEVHPPATIRRFSPFSHRPWTPRT